MALTPERPVGTPVTSAMPSWLRPQWPAPERVRALSTFRAGGASRPPFASFNLGDHVGDAPMATAKNRRHLKETAGLPTEPSWLVQVHGTRVVDLDAPRERGSSADAAVTRRPGAVCAILTADCLPVLFTTAAGDRVGAAHAGWRGLAGGVLEATVAALGAPAGDLLAWLGPAIGPGHFEVGSEVREAFLCQDAGAAAAFVPKGGGQFLADLYALARLRLGRLGIERIFGGGECTYADADKYFSYRRDGRTGRQATLIWLERPGP